MRIIGKTLTKLKYLLFAAVFVMVAGLFTVSESYNPVFAEDNPAETVDVDALTWQSRHDGHDDDDDNDKKDKGSCH